MKAIPLSLAILVLVTASVDFPFAAGADAGPSDDAQSRKPIPWDQIGAEAGGKYSGSGVMLHATASGARLRCDFQKIDGEVTETGLRLNSTASDSGHSTFSLTAASLHRDGAINRVLAAMGRVMVNGKVARYEREGLVEEYSVSVDGVRQDFIITEKPAGAGRLRMVARIEGASISATDEGARLTLHGSGREIAYSRLKVTDAAGRELAASMQVESSSQLAIVVDDSGATYPVRVDPMFSDADWQGLSAVRGANDYVGAMAVDPSGPYLYVGGNFTQIGSIAASRIARWDGSVWTVLGSGLSGSVGALLVSGSDLYVGGSFTTAGGNPASKIARWDGSSWSALGTGMNISGSVSALASYGPYIVAAGDFITAGGVTVNRIAMWDGSAWAAIGTGMSASVYTLATAPDGGAPFGQVLYAGGTFTTAGGTPANRIAKWNGTSWSALGAGADSAVNVIAVSGTDVYVGGSFTSPAARIAKWNGAAWSSLGTGMNNLVVALRFVGPDLYAAGTFTTSGGVTTNGVARWNGVSWSALGTGVGGDNPAYAVCFAEYGGQVWAGGYFTTAGGISASRLALWNPGTSTWSAVNGGINGKVYALAWIGSHLYAGGDFTTAGDVSASKIARWDGSTWSALGTGMNNTVYAIASFGADIYAGGAFTTAGGVLVNGVAKWNGSAWSALAGGLNGTTFGTYALASSGGGLYVGGVFTTAGGVAANNIAKWNGTAFSALGAGTGSAVYSLALSGTDVYAGGAFTTAGGAPANFIAKWNGSAWSALGSGTNSHVYALVTRGSDLFAAGTFGTAGGVSATVAKWNGTAWSAVGQAFFSNQVNALAVVGTEMFAGGILTPYIWHYDTSLSFWVQVGSGTNNFVRALAGSSSHLYVGGDSSTAGGKVAAYLARVKTQDVPDIVVEGPDMANITDGGSKSFGVIGTGATASVQFTVLNAGTADLTGLTVTIDGADPTHFSVTQQPSAPVIPGGGTTFTVLFTTSGTKNAALHIASNDPDENPFDITITGTQIGPGDLDPTFNPNANGDVFAIAVQPDNDALGIGLPDDRAIALGGAFTTISGVTRNYFARIQSDGSAHYTTPIPASAAVYGLGVQSGSLNVDTFALGGDFTTLDGTARNYCGRVQNALDSGFNPNVGGGGVRAMAVQPDGKILIGGLFTTVSGTARSYLARLNANGMLDTGFNPGANATVNTIAVQTDGKILVGGYFSNIASTARNYLARLNANGTIDSGFNPNPNSVVLCTAVQADGKVLLGGWFSTVRGTARNYLARVTDAGALDTSYNPNAGSFVYSLAPQTDGKVIASGLFTTMGGTARNYIARVNADGTLDTGFNPNASSNVYGVMLQEDGMVLLGGAFATVGGQARNRIARVGGSPATQSFSVTSSSRIQWLRGGASPETTNVIFERLNTGTNYDWLPLGTGTRIAGGWEITGLSLPGSGSVRARAITTGGQYNASSSLMQAGTTYSLLTPLESWRQTWFGSSSNSGNGADTYDYDLDGLVNLIEWGCNLNPTTASTLPAAAALAGANIEFTYTRSVAALNAGTIFTVEWSDTLLSPWSTVGVTKQILSDNGTVQQVKATVPTGGNPRRFMRLSITAP